MFQSAVRFLVALVATFALLTYMWVNAAQAQEPGRCELIKPGVVMCDGPGWRMPEAPRGTVKHRPATSVQHRVAAALAAHRLAETGGRVGTTEIIARLGR